MTLQPEDFWSFGEWLLRPGAFLESALLQGIALVVLGIVGGLLVGYLVAAARYGPGEGFYSVARVVRDLLRFDLPGTSPRRVYALARLAFKEAIRRKVLIVVGVFAVLLLLAGWFLDPTSDNPARLYISFVLTSTNYLILFLALFISCFSLPADIKNRTIYTIVTKPVRPTEIILGRVLGFTAVGTVLLVPMGLASYLFVDRGLRHDHAVEEVQPLAGDRYEGQTSYDRNHRHRFTIDPEGTGLTDFARGHRHVVTRQGDEFVVGPPIDALRARVPSYGNLRFLDRSGAPTDLGIDVGHEHIGGGYGSSGVMGLLQRSSTGPRRHQHGYVEGGTLGAGIFIFGNVTPARYPDGIPLDMDLRAFRTLKGDIVTGVRGTITLRNPDRPAVESNPIAFVVKEYEIDERVLPLQIEGTDGTQTRTLDLFDDLVTPQGRLEIVVRCIDRGQYLGMTKSDVYLRPTESTFSWNLTKAYISIWLQMLMVISFGVMFSTFLTGSVAMIATAICVLLGFSAEAIYDTRYHIEAGQQSMGGGPIESMIRLVRQDPLTTEFDMEELPRRIIQGVDAVIVYSLDAIATALPNLPKMLGTAEYVASGFDIFGSLLARHAVATFSYFLGAGLVGYFFLKTREIAA